ncbi:SDR family oxidoreductase [uncultured Salinisphaera sp.]|uniref:SDR family oxidoreductase n=1 Tax=uncultured Salinisphaera sp. TaxID=359372 RepID=UPI0032B2E2A1|tara:strand:- start:930 stop:1691 length:762 start_codon:yes stop_codon:yes gene_type:complete
MTEQSKSCLITGAARGIGRAITRRLLEDGWHVWAVDNDPAALADLAACLASKRLSTRRVDVAVESDVAELADAINSADAGLDLLVNNAGLADPFSGPVETLSLTDWQRVVDVNLTGVFLMTKHHAALLRARSGAIVNLTSTRAFQSEPDTEAYAATKGGIHALTHALAQSLGPAVRVNAIAPGWIDVRDQQPGAVSPEPLRAIDHEQHRVGRVGQGHDIAGLVTFLAGPDAAFITGQTITADGGMTTRMIYAH